MNKEWETDTSRSGMHISLDKYLEDVKEKLKERPIHGVDIKHILSLLDRLQFAADDLQDLTSTFRELTSQIDESIKQLQEKIRNRDAFEGFSRYYL